MLHVKSKCKKQTKQVWVRDNPEDNMKQKKNQKKNQTNPCCFNLD